MKKLMQLLLVITMSVILSLPLNAQAISKDNLYLGQTPPGNTPKIFILPVLDKFFAAERIAISNDGKEIYYQELDGYPELDGKPHTQRIKYLSFTNGKWNGPFVLFEELAAPGFSVAGDTMYLQKSIREAYYSVKSGEGWSAPKRFLNDLKITHYLQVTNNGNYYISAYPADNIGGIDRSRLLIAGSDTTITSLGPPINTAMHDLDYFVSRDDSFMVISTRAGLCISFHKSDGSWTNPKNLGKTINFGLNEWGAYISKDNKYLFYTTGTKPDYSDVYIYWVSIADKIDSLKKTNYAPYLKSQIKNQTVTVNKAFSYTLPETTFIDDDGSNTLSYSATLNNGDRLPDWLAFNSATRAFAGTPVKVDSMSIKVTAADQMNARASCTFKVYIVNVEGTTKGGSNR